MRPNSPFVVWRASSHSVNGGACVEWAPEEAATTGTVPVRDSKNPDGPVLAFPAAGWQAFVATLHKHATR
ncbi:DUF397 domain-containing protein [Streptomyces johnsoniae]|uniref:DUF397 domain-containing protein n=1 Tax=Streptomyces johnsoniae TaxID=3075532 RepID=A0ABU2RY81_9ACTN|nr:DUF397 domain-containing protein [Streptomyces sp. DSM 41886]MDT0441703.1 DUF397 domain-containing protein [Streptomyces sp. DSM 41886]